MQLEKYSHIWKQPTSLELLGGILQKFQKLEITSTNDIVTRYQQIIEASSQLVDFFFDKWSQEDNSSMDEINKFFHSYYQIKSDDGLMFHLQCDIAKLVPKEQDIYVIESDSTSIITLDKVNKNHIESFYMIHKRLLSLLKQHIDRLQKQVSADQQMQYQNSLEEKQKTIIPAIIWVLSDSGLENTATINSKHLAIESDFYSGTKSIDEVIPDIKAEDINFLNNLLVGIDITTGEIQKLITKQENFSNYFNTRSWIPSFRLEESNENLADTGLINYSIAKYFPDIANNIWSILTNEEKLKIRMEWRFAWYRFKETMINP